MRRLITVGLVAMACLAFVRPHAAPAPYRVVFDLTSRDTLDQKAVLRWVKEVTASDAKAQVEVVMYAKGFELVKDGTTLFANEVKAALANPNVKFKVCAIALKNNGVEQSQLLPGVDIVPNGIYEIVSKQYDRWGYIKAVH